MSKIICSNSVNSVITSAQGESLPFNSLLVTSYWPTHRPHLPPPPSIPFDYPTPSQLNIFTPLSVHTHSAALCTSQPSSGTDLYSIPFYKASLWKAPGFNVARNR